MEKAKIIEVLKSLRDEEDKRKFNQTVDLIINLKDFDIKRESVNLFVDLPHKIKDKKVAAFLEKKSSIIDSIPKQEFEQYKNKKAVKGLVKEYDFFISAANLMPLVAATFGKYLGPAGKMPSPQLGILKTETDIEIKKLVEKIDKNARIKSKEPSLKFSIGKEDMKDEDIAENVLTAYNAVLNALPRKKENLKNVMIKLTMGKPKKIE